jgi:alanine dehydrogenase
MPYILEIANKGAEGAIATNPDLAFAVNTHAGMMQHLVRLTTGKEK